MPCCARYGRTSSSSYIRVVCTLLLCNILSLSPSPHPHSALRVRAGQKYPCIVLVSNVRCSTRERLLPRLLVREETPEFAAATLRNAHPDYSASSPGITRRLEELRNNFSASSRVHHVFLIAFSFFSVASNSNNGYFAVDEVSSFFIFLARQLDPPHLSNEFIKSKNIEPKIIIPRERLKKSSSVRKPRFR